MTTITWRGRSIRSLAAIGTMLAVAACAGTNSPASSIPAAAASMAPTVAPTTAPSPSAAPAQSSTLIAQVHGDGKYPGFAVEAPAGWSTNGGFFLHSGTISGISVWDVQLVPRDPCLWKDSLEAVGGSVDDVVKALTAQATRQASKPVDVTLAGYKGQYLEWSVPTDAVVTGDADFKGCDTWPDNGHQDFVSWMSGDKPDSGERYQQMAGQVDRLWILDVDGQTLVVDATHEPGATTAHVDEQARIVDSLRFVKP